MSRTQQTPSTLPPLVTKLPQSPRAALTKPVIAHHRGHSFLRFRLRHTNQNAFAEREPVCLYHERAIGAANIGDCGVVILKHLELSGRNMVFLHQLLGKRLAAFDARRAFFRAETRNADRVQRVHCAQRKRIVRRNNREIHAVFTRKAHDFIDIRRLHGHARRLTRDSRISGQRVNRFNLRILRELPNDRVLATAAADNHDFHAFSSSMMEQAHSGKRHCNSIVIAGFDHLIVAD